MSTAEQIQELRVWAAGVCDRKIIGSSNGVPLAVTNNEDFEGEHGEYNCEPWCPDQNIAQAFEVLDAVIASMESRKFVCHFKLRRSGFGKRWCCDIDADDCFNAVNGTEDHDDRCVAILLACRKAASCPTDQAWEQLQ